MIHGLLVFLRFTNLLDLLLRSVHAAEHIRNLAGVVALVVDWASGIKGLRGILHLDVVDAETRLVTERPDDDGRVVTVTDDHTLHSIDKLILPLRIVGGVSSPMRPVVYAEAVGFKITFVNQINAVAITEIVPTRIIRIMARSDGVEVVLFEEEDILDHAFKRNSPTMFGIRFMAIATFENYALAIDLQHAINDLDLFEANIHRRSHRIAASGLNAHHQPIKVRIFGRPFMRLSNIGLERDHRRRVALDRSGAQQGCHGPTVGIKQLSHNLHTLRFRFAAVHQLDIDRENGILILLVEDCRCGNVFKMNLRHRNNRYLTEDARHPPHVLIFGIGARRPLPDTHRENVASTEHHKLRDVKLGREARPHGHTYISAVHIAFVAGIHTVKTEADDLALPSLRNIEVLAVGACRVLIRHIRGVNVEGILNVRVPRLAVA